MNFRLPAGILFTRTWIALPLFMAMAEALSAATPSGEAVFQQRCASCHDSGDPRIPMRAELNTDAGLRLDGQHSCPHAPRRA
jgi:mono/diheme cytochrome c family protein